MKRLLNSDYSGKIEIVEEGGMLSLNTQKVCYSGRTLHEAFYPSLSSFDWSTAKHVLILGLGGGTLVRMLRHDLNYLREIHAVDFDAAIVEAANHYFGLSDDLQLQIFCADALAFLESNHCPYDVIICDLFIQASMPDFMEAEMFWKEAARSLAPNGRIVVNAFTQKKRVMAMRELAERSGFSMERPTLVNGTNLMMLGKKEQQ
jgi:spermidine synthase